MKNDDPKKTSILKKGETPSWINGTSNAMMMVSF